MSNVVGEAVVHVRADTTSTGAAVSEEGAKAGKGYASGFVQNLKGIAVGIVGVLAVEKIKSFLTESVAEARESQKVGAATTQIIKATGGAANVTSAQMGQLTTSISNKIGVDDEAIQSAANLVLAFKNVRNEAGKGNDVFNQTVQAGQDLAAAGFGSATSASKLLAKALNDPVKGISSLTRVLGPATDAQKKHVAALVASGHTLEAQKFILEQVQGRVGGLAAATATNGEKSRVAWDNLKETIGGKLLPVIDKVEGVFARKVVPALMSTLSGTSLVGKGFHEFGVLFGIAFGYVERGARAVLPLLIDGFKRILPVVEQLAQTIGKDLVKVFQNLEPVLAPLVLELIKFGQSLDLSELKVAGGILTGIGSALVAFTGFLADNAAVVKPVVVGVLAMVAAYKAYVLISKAVAIVQGVATGLTAAYTVALGGEAIALEEGSIAAKVFAASQAILNAVMDANPLALVVIALIGLAAGLIYAYKHSQTFRDVVSAALGVVSSAFHGFMSVVTAVFDTVKGAISGAIGFIEKHWGLIVSIIGGPLGAVVVFVIKHFDTIKAVISAAVAAAVATLHQWAHFADGVISAVGNIVSAVVGLPGKIKGIAGDMFDAGKTIIGRLIDGIKAIGTGAGGVADSILSAIKGAINSIIDRLDAIHISFNTHIPGVGTVTIDPFNIGHLAAGTDNWRGGLSVVGERGPELALLPRGTRVIPNNRTSGALAGMIDYRALAVALRDAGVDGRHITIAPQLPTGDPEANAMAVFNRLAAAGVV